MLDPRFVIVGAILNLIGAGTYAFDTLKGGAKPNRVSWVLWALAPLIAFAAEITKGVGWQSLSTLAPGVGPLMVLAASVFNRKSYWKITTFDLTCGGLSILALLLWAITKSGNVAIVFSILADALASVPTLVKAYSDPKSESYFAYLATAINGGIALLTITNWQFAEYAFPVYLVVMFGLITGLVAFPKIRFSLKPQR